jgi:hypothetical protein
MVEQPSEEEELKRDPQEAIPKGKSAEGNRKRRTHSKRVEANRKNATRSTGPKTVEGKNVVKLNPIKHGLLSKGVLIPGENEADFVAFRDGILDAWKPVGAQESFLVNQITNLAWRIQRAGRIETGILTKIYCEILRNRASGKAGRYVETELDKSMAIFGKTRILDEVAYKKFSAEAETERTKAESEEATLGEAFITDATKGDSLTKLSRYETALDRSLYRALHELQRLQAARAGQLVPVPTVADVNVSINEEVGRQRRPPSAV